MVHSAFDVSPQTGEDKIQCNRPYVSSIVAIVKAIEFMLLMFSFALASNFKADVTLMSIVLKIPIAHSKIDFHIFIMCVGWLGVLLLSLTYLFNVVNVLRKRFKNIFNVLAIIHVVGAIFTLISTIIILDNVIDFRKNRHVWLQEANFCDLDGVSCASYEGAGVTSFFAIIAISFDAVLHIMKAMRIHKERQFEKEEEEEGGEEKPEEDVEQAYVLHTAVLHNPASDPTA